MKQAELESALATVHDLLVEQGLRKAAETIRNHTARCAHIGHDNWNGGTAIWEISIELPAREFARIRNRREQIENQINAELKEVVGEESWYSAKLVPAKSQSRDWRSKLPELPRQIRLNIVDSLRIENVFWYGTLNEVEFLSRIFDLISLPSTDSRFKDASGDIWQHCINNNDWDRDWVFSDRRLNLLDGPAERFLQFLCETLHPVVRPDRTEALKLAAQFNDQLRIAKWEIIEEERIAGRPRFHFRNLRDHGVQSVMRARTVADALNAGAMEKAIERMERSINTDPDLAIGTAKELVESCCKTILNRRTIPYGKTDDLGDLTKKVVTALQLVPEGITDEAKGADNIRHILRNLTQLTNNLARLRGLYGTGHGRDGEHRGLQPRHARLAVASAVAFIDFVAETHHYREQRSPRG